MDTKERFIKIVENGDIKQLIDLLKPLSSSGKKSLSKTIQKILRDKNIYLDENRYLMKEDGHKPTGITKKLIYSEESRLVLELASFVCFDYNKIRRDHVTPSLDLLEELILPWYQPSWLNQYFHEIANFYFNYEKMLTFEKKGWLTPIKQFIADNAAYGLLKSKEKLAENIWYLFEYYTTIGNDDRWIERFKQLSQNGDISRERLLRETLLTATRGLNKPFTGWFFKLFKALDPTDDELLKLQDELLLCLDSPHSKPITDTLKYIKIIMLDETFRVELFIQKLPILMVSEVKGIINTTLGIIDTLIKKYPQKKETLASYALDALNTPDEKIQIKTIKLLQKHQLLDESMIEMIVPYWDTLFTAAKHILPTEKHPIPQEFATQPSTKEEELTALETYHTLDDLIYLYTDIFFGNPKIRFDNFMRHLTPLHQAINTDNIEKAKVLFYQLKNNEEYIDTIHSLMKKALTGYLLLRFKQCMDTASFNEEFPDISHLLESDKVNISLSPIAIDKCPICTYFQHIISLKIDRLLQNNTAPLLCEATQTPAYIAQEIFDDRIAFHQSKHFQIDPIDMNILKNKIYPPDFFDSMAVSWQVVHADIQKYREGPTETITMLEIEKTNMLREYNYISGYISAVMLKDVLYLMPNHLHILLIPFMQTIMRCSTYSDQLVYEYAYSVYTSKTGNIEAIQAAIEVMSTIQTDQNSSMIYLFIAASMLYENKTIRDSIAEYWHGSILSNTMNHQLLGETLGKLEHNEYAPLKRFTDLIVPNMLNISSIHNEGLHTLLSAMITQMNDEPIKGTKKLLEIYLEVLNLTKLDVLSETLDKLRIWGEAKSLKGLVNKIKGVNRG